MRIKYGKYFLLPCLFLLPASCVKTLIRHIRLQQYNMRYPDIADNMFCKIDVLPVSQSATNHCGWGTDDGSWGRNKCYYYPIVINFQ